MKLSNVANIFGDWLKSGFRFGKGFSDYVAYRMDIPADKSRVGTAIFDTVAGATLTWMAGASILSTVAGVLTAVSVATTAPLLRSHVTLSARRRLPSRNMRTSPVAVTISAFRSYSSVAALKST